MSPVDVPLKVATYNIHKGVGTDGRYSPERILAVLAEIEADVVVLQEADRRFGSRATVLPFSMLAEHSVYAPVRMDHNPVGIGWHGNAVLVSNRVTVTAVVPLALPSLEPRGAVLVECVIDGCAVRLGSMHLDLTGLKRRHQARAIVLQVAARPDAMPTVLMGDLNEWRANKGCLTDFATSYAIAATSPSFPAGHPVGRLDRIMTSSGIEVRDCGTHRSRLSKVASDHLPVWASLRLRAR